MSVRVKRHGITHYLSHCNQCEFQAEGITDEERAKVRNDVRRHVEKTGHEVSVEAGSVTRYIRN